MIPLFMHHTAGWFDPISWQLLIGGLVGGFLRALLGRGPTWEKILGLHIFSGAAAAVMLPNVYKYFAGTELTGSPLFWIAAGIFIGLFGNFIIVAVLWRLGVFKDDPRASDPEGVKGFTFPPGQQPPPPSSPPPPAGGSIGDGSPPPPGG